MTNEPTTERLSQITAIILDLKPSSLLSRARVGNFLLHSHLATRYFS